MHTGQFSDAAAEQHLAAILRQRRDKIARVYLTSANPIVNAALSPRGVLTFENAAVAARAADAPAGYASTWSLFDNETGQSRPLGEGRGNRPEIDAPAPLPEGSGAIVQVDVRAEGTGPAAWQRPVHLFFRRSASGWTLVGLDRGTR